MADLDLLEYLHPDLLLKNRVKKLFASARQAIDWHRLLFTGEPCRHWLVYFLCLLADLDERAVVSLCQRLSVSPRLQHILTLDREEVHRATNLIFWRRMHTAPPRPSEIHGWFQPLATEVLLYAMARSGNEQVQRCLSSYFTHLRSVQCELVGSDIKQLGISPGPIYKEIFQRLLTARLDGELVTRQDEVDFVSRHYLQDKHRKK